MVIDFLSPDSLWFRSRLNLTTNNFSSSRENRTLESDCSDAVSTFVPRQNFGSLELALLSTHLS